VKEARPLMPNMIGAYGDWAAGLLSDPPRLSFRRPEWKDLDAWRRAARTRYRDALLQPNTGPAPRASVQHRIEFDGLEIEDLSWQLPYGPPTEALLLKPAGARGRLPAVVGLHDHGGNKYFGRRKITQISKDPHPMMIQHQQRYYSGVAWANELARRGYVVLVHDAFTFGSRRMRAADLPAVIKGDLVEQNPEAEDEIQRYNRFAANHEHLIAKSLFCAGTTWPGVFVGEDQRAVDYLLSRSDVDPKRVGCCGLSGGGLRTVYLTGADERIRCACCVGLMTTWRDYLLNKCYTHTWMIYIPGLPRDLDYPEIFGLAAPNPILVLNNREDQLFTLPEMQRADRILTDVYRKAGAPSNYRASFYPGPHKFDREMQKEAFEWFDKHLKG
jgi:dienelactone hydrolase